MCRIPPGWRLISSMETPRNTGNSTNLNFSNRISFFLPSPFMRIRPGGGRGLGLHCLYCSSPQKEYFDLTSPFFPVTPRFFFTYGLHYMYIEENHISSSSKLRSQTFCEMKCLFFVLMTKTWSFHLRFSAFLGYFVFTRKVQLLNTCLAEKWQSFVKNLLLTLSLIPFKSLLRF